MPEMTMLPTKVNWGNEDEEKRIVGYVKERLEEARRRADPFKRSALIDFRNFCSRPENWGYNWQMVEPLTQEAINSTAESVFANVFGKDRFFDLRPLNAQSPVQVEKNREKLLRSLRQTRWKLKYFNWGDDAIKFGRGTMVTLACPWWRRRQQNEQMQDADGFGINLGNQRQSRDVMESRVDCINVSYWNQLPYPYEGFPDEQLAPFHAFWIDYPLQTIRAMKFQPWARWQNTEKVKGNIEVDTGSRSVAMSTYDYEFASQRLAVGGWNLLDDATDGAECVRHGRSYFYYEAPPGGEGCRAWAVVCEDKLMVCRGSDYEHVRKPTAPLRWIPIDATNLWHCLGVPAVIRSYQDRANLTLSQKFEMRQKVLTPTKIAWPGFPVDQLSKLMAPPGSLIPLTGSALPNQLTDFDEPKIRPDLFNDEDDVRQGVMRATKQTDVSTGVADPGNVNLKAYASLAYLGTKARQAMMFRVLYFEENGAVPQLDQHFAILQQIAPDNEYVPLTEHNDTLVQAGAKGGFDLTRDDMTGEYEFYAVGSSQTLEGPEMAALLMPLFEKAAGVRGVGERLNAMEIFQRLGRMIAGQSITWAILTDEEFEKKQQQQPPPLPMKLTGNLKDFGTAKAEALQRMGLLTARPEPSDHDTASATEQEKTKREIIKAALRPPKVVERQEVTAGV